MKSVLTISLLLLSVSLAIGQTSLLQAERNDKEEKELLKLEQQAGEAYKNRDKAFFRRQLADDFIATDALGNVYNKAQSLEALDKLKIESYSLSELSVKIYGDTAIVTGIWTDKATFNGINSSGTYRFTDVAVKRNGRWLTIATQNTLLPKKE